jgi:PAS domain S-box-containing protein
MRRKHILLLGLSEEESAAISEAAACLGCDQSQVISLGPSFEEVSRLRDRCPAVLIVDQALFWKHHQTLARQLRSARSHFGLRSVLLIPAEAGDQADLQTAAQEGFDDVLFFPLRSDEISVRLEFQLAKAGQAEDSFEHFRRTEATAGIASWEFDRWTQRISWSETLDALLGYQPQEVTPSLEFVREHVYAEDLDDAVQAFLEQSSGSGDVDISLRYMHRDGEIRFARIQGGPRHRDNQGQLVGTFQDITQRKRVENKLVELLEQTQMRSRETQAMLDGTKAILEHQEFQPAVGKIMAECQSLIGAPFCFAGLFETDGGAVQAVHWCHEQETGQPQGRPGDRIGTSGAWQRLLAGGRTVRLNQMSRIEISDLFPGRQAGRSLLAAPIVIAGHSVGAIALADKEEGFSETDRNMLAAFSELVAVSLRNSRNLERMSTLAAALEQSGEGIILTDPEFRAVYVNPAFERMSGFEASEVTARFPSLLWGNEDSFLLAEAWERVRTGRIWKGQLRSEHKDGSILCMEATASPIVDQDGRISHYLLLFQNITEKLELERQLRQSQKMEAIGTLAGGIAHDFNNMLMGIMGFTEMALRNLPQDRHQERKYLNSVLKSIYRAKDLVHQILTFSRQKETEKRPLQPDSVLKEAIKLLEASLPSSIDIRCQTAANSPQVLADPSQVHQMIMNLCTNAAQAMPEGGTLTVSMGGAELNGADSSGGTQIEPGRYLLIEVRDTGRGILPEIRERIFEPFFTTKAQDKGTGMGLAVIHGIVTELGGSIQVASEPGQGSIFSIFIPAIDGDRAGGQVEKATADRLVRGKGRILFVDDEEDIVIWGVRSLEQLGYKVKGTTDAQEAWEVMQQEADRFDLVVTDLTMPKMSGRELIKRIREMRRDLPIILCTGYSEEMQPGSETMDAADALLVKPFSMAEFSWTVRSVLEQADQPVTEPGKA